MRGVSTMKPSLSGYLVCLPSGPPHHSLVVGRPAGATRIEGHAAAQSVTHRHRQNGAREKGHSSYLISDRISTCNNLEWAVTAVEHSGVGLKFWQVVAGVLEQIQLSTERAK